MTETTPSYQADGQPPPPNAERLTPYRERVLRQWPRDRIKPLTVARGLDSVLAELDALRAQRDDARAAIMALARCSPFFVTIDPKGDVEICQFCAETGGHAPDCPWLLVEAIAAGNPAFPTPAMLRALYEADAALTAVFNDRAIRQVDPDLRLQVDRAISRCRAAGTNLPWPGEDRT